MTQLARFSLVLCVLSLLACGDDGASPNPDAGGSGTGGDSGAGSGGSGGTGGTAGTGGSGGTGGGDTDGGEPVGTVIGSEGGQATFSATPGGPVTGLLTVPSGALDEDTTFEISASDTPPTALPDFLTPLSRYYTFTPHGTQFAQPVSIALNVNGTPADPNQVSVWTLDDEDDTTWEQLGLADLLGGPGIFSIDHISVFALAQFRTSGSVCIPMCGANECGPDQCGRQCGTCTSNNVCRSGFCQATQGMGEVCGNRVDDDNDGARDCADSECSALPACRPVMAEVCNNGSDDDGDQSVDCADPDCASAPNCQVAPEICDNGQTDDADHLIDCADPDCSMTGCGNLNVSWNVQLNGNSSTCQATGGDTVAISATNDATGLQYTATAVCSQGTYALVVPAGTYDIALTLQEPGPTAIANANLANAIVPGGGNGNPGATVFNITSSTCASVLISRIYNAGGSDAAGYARDFVELHNRTGQSIDISDWSLQTRVNDGNSGWIVTPLGNGTPGNSVIPASGFWLVELGRSNFDSNIGSAVPNPDTVGASTTNLSGYSTDIVLRNTTSSVQNDQCPGSAIDAFGNVCGEGQTLVFGTGGTQMIHRPDGCTDVDNNSADFSSTALVTPRNSSSTPVPCPACN